MGGDATPAHIAKVLWSQLFRTAPKPGQSFEGQTIIITGSNTGLGFEAAKHVIRLKCTKLIIAVRSMEKGEVAKEAIIQATRCEPETIKVWSLDLASYDSVKAFAQRSTKELDRLDVLIENAGVANFEWNWVEDNERMVTINVVSTFLLALLLLPKLLATAAEYQVQTHLTVVSSDTHFNIDFIEKDGPRGIFATLNDKSESSIPDRYPTTKLMQVLIVRELARRLSIATTAGAGPESSQGVPVIINCVNPGICHSELARDIDGFAVRVAKFIFARTAEEGARVLVHGAAGGEATHGQYMDLGRIATPATIVTGPGGKYLQERLYRELMGKLEGIEAGVVGVLRA